jgi:hypothetical protein
LQNKELRMIVKCSRGRLLNQKVFQRPIGIRSDIQPQYIQ